MRQTSLDAYRNIKENGYLSDARWMVYDCIFNHGPLTPWEAQQILSAHRRSTVSARFSELEEMGLIFNTGDTKVPTGCNHHGSIYDSTDLNKPKKLVKKISEKQALKNEIMELKARLSLCRCGLTQSELNL